MIAKKGPYTGDPKPKPKSTRQSGAARGVGGFKGLDHQMVDADGRALRVVDFWRVGPPNIPQPTKGEPNG